MKWVLRVGGGVIAFFLTVVLAGSGYWWVSSQWGWEDMPEHRSATSSVSHVDPRFEDISPNATSILEVMTDLYGVPGASAAVALDGELVWAAATGHAGLESQDAMSTMSVVRIGSTSKAMTATVLARLHDAGTLSMDDTVGEHGTPLNPIWADLRLDRLMSHTAGFPGYEENTDFPDNVDTLLMRRSYTSVEDGLRLVDGSDMIAVQGERYHYSSFDVNLAAWAAEKASGVSFGELLEQEIREPLGLETPLLGDFGEPHQHQSVFYETREKGGEWQVRIWPHTDVSQRWPGGGLVSRSIDLVRVGSAWLDEDYISAETRELFWTPMQLNDGSANDEGYGLGWRVGESTTRFGEDYPVRVVHHGGISRGAMSWLIIYPDLHMVVAVNINTNTTEFADFASIEPDLTRLFTRAAGRAPDTPGLANE